MGAMLESISAHTQASNPQAQLVAVLSVRLVEVATALSLKVLVNMDGVVLGATWRPFSCMLV